MTSLPVPPVPTTALWSGRLAAVLAVGSALLHLICLTAMNVGTLPSVLMVAMILGCLFCAHHLWTRASNQDWALLGVMNLAMICVHLPMAGCGHGSEHTGATAHAMTQAASASESPWLMAPLAVSCAEAAIAALVLFYRTRAVDVTSAAVNASNSRTRAVEGSSLARTTT